MTTPQLLQTQDLQAFYGDAQALFGVDVALQPGELVAVIGANGAGKSTLLKCLTGLVRAPADAIQWRGQPIGGSHPAHIVQQGIAMVPEGRRLFPSLTIEENLRMGAQAKRKGPWSLQRLYSLFPVLKEKRLLSPANLSGGQQQMVAIGRAFMARPQLLMLDEPSLGLSPLLTKEIFSIICRIRDETGTAILVVEQNAAIALAHADDGYIMELGRVVAADTCEALSRKADVQDSYLGAGAHTGASGTAQRWKRKKTWR